MPFIMDLLGMYSGSDDEDEQEEVVAPAESPSERPTGVARSDADAARDSATPREAAVSDENGASPQASRREAMDMDGASPALRTGAQAEEEPRPLAPLALLPPELQERPDGEPFAGVSANVDKWMKLKEGGMSLADAIQQRRDFCNPYMLNMLIEYNNLDEYGSCYPPQVWDPKAISPEDFPDSLEKEHSEATRKREEEQRLKGKIEFAHGGVQSSAAPQMNIAPQSSGILPGSQLSAVSAAAAAAIAKAKAGGAGKSQQGGPKPRRPSKWDNAANPLMK